MEEKFSSEEFNHIVEKNCYLLTKLIFGTSDNLEFVDHMAWTSALFSQLETSLEMLVKRGASEESINFLVTAFKHDLDMICQLD